jgi:hypothetical protein
MPLTSPTSGRALPRIRRDRALPASERIACVREGVCQFVADAAQSKRVHHLRSPAEMRALLDAVRREYASA